MDPFESVDFFGPTVRCLEYLCQGQTQPDVHPVYVVNDFEVQMQSITGEAELPDVYPVPRIFRYCDAISKMLSTKLSHLAAPLAKPRFHFHDPHLIVQRTTSHTEAARLLSEYAETENASLILVNTQGRKGMSRFIEGSFAETLMAITSIPVLIVGAREAHAHKASSEVASPGRGILFSTLLTNSSRLAYRKVVEIARNLAIAPNVVPSHISALGIKTATSPKMEVILFHSMTSPVEPIFQSGLSLLGGVWVPVQSYFGREASHEIRRAMVWKRWGRRHGLKIQNEIRDFGTPVANSILDTAKKRNTALIILENCSSRLEAFFIGSVARQVMRDSECPVLILGRKYLSVKKAEVFKPAA